MKKLPKESISRILLITFPLMLVVIATIIAPAGTFTVLIACFALLPVAALFLGVDKHRKFICIELIVAFLFITIDHIAGQKRKEEHLNSCYEKIDELEKKLEQYEPAER